MKLGRSPNEVNNKKSLHLTKQAEKALKTTFLEAKLFKSDAISTAHLLLCILRNENDPTTKILHNFDIFYEDVKEVFQELFADSEETETPRGKAETPPKNSMILKESVPGFQDQTGKKIQNPCS